MWCSAPLAGRSTLYCSAEHGNLYRKDQSYFNGNLRETLGWASKTCQICGKVVKKGGQSHHVYGIGNDPEGSRLVFLCPGCHQSVTMMGNRVFTEEAWEQLIRYSTLRKRGREKLADVIVRVEATIEEERDGEL